MITEGLLTNVDYTSNKCYIRIPIFETTTSPEPVIFEGRFAIPPGCYNGYKPNDMVWVGFINEKLNMPIVLGKMFLGAADEDKGDGGQINAIGLKVNGDSALIPQETKINEAPEGYGTISDMINQIKTLKAEVDRLSASLREIENGDNLDFLDLIGSILTDANDEILKDKHDYILVSSDKGEADYVLPIEEEGE